MGVPLVLGLTLQHWFHNLLQGYLGQTSRISHDDGTPVCLGVHAMNQLLHLLACS